jgi:hypothetical protein
LLFLWNDADLGCCSNFWFSCFDRQLLLLLVMNRANKDACCNLAEALTGTMLTTGKTLF